MLAQREVAQPAKTAKVPKKEAAERPRKDRPAKMNFSDAHALKVLPEKIAVAETEIAALEEKLSDAGLYASDPGRFADLSAKLVEVRARKDEDEERWLALEMLREELEPR
jgi:ATP-binding cassette subfamily F protein uup